MCMIKSIWSALLSVKLKGHAHILEEIGQYPAVNSAIAVIKLLAAKSYKQEHKNNNKKTILKINSLDFPLPGKF